MTDVGRILKKALCYIVTTIRADTTVPLRKSDSVYSQWEMLELESMGEAVPLLYTATFTPGSVRTLDPLTHSLTQPLEL